MDELVWFENPGWDRHVIASGLREMINAAADDTDGDGIPEIALAHGFDMEAAKSAGHRQPPAQRAGSARAVEHARM